MKKYRFFALFLGFLLPLCLSAQPYFKGTFDFNPVTKALSFSVKPVGGNITSAIGYFEFDVSYPLSSNLTFGAITNNTATFPGLSVATSAGANYNGQKIQIFNFTSTITSNTYTAGTEYLVFSVILSGTGAPDVQLITNYVTEYPVFAVSSGSGTPLFDPSLTDIFYQSGTSTTQSTSGNDTYITLSAVLPLELISFTAKANSNTIDLAWRSIRETNFVGYEIERAHDGINFRNIGFEKGLGQSGQTDYTFSDKDVELGIDYFYRLKMLDTDGSNTFSPIVKAKLAGRIEPTLYPNPAIDQVFIDWNGLQVDRVTLYNVQGSALFTTNQLDEVRSALNVDTLPVGWYMIRAYSEQNAVSSFRFYKG
jgi:hypothetical protein